MRISLAAAVFAVFTAVWASTNESLHKELKKSKKPYITLKNSNFEKVLAGPRDSYIAVLLTATSPQVGCVLCGMFDPEFNLVASSWTKKNPGASNLYFAKADFSDNSRRVFESFNVNSVPKMMFYKPTNDSSPANSGFEDYRFYEGDQVQFLTNFIKDNTGYQIKVVKPVRYDNMIFSAVTIIGAAILIWKFQAVFYRIVLSRQLWGGFMIILTLLFITGYMFCQIRNAPYSGTHGDGRVQYFAGGQQNQFAVETNIMSSLYGVLAVFMVALVSKAPKISQPKTQAIVVFVLVLGVWFVHSLIIDIFSAKSYGYPFRLLKLFNF